MATTKKDTEAAPRGYVKYMGTATVRRITRDDWMNAGVSDQDTVEWTPENQWTVPRDSLSTEAWDRIQSEKAFAEVTTNE